MKKKSLSEKVSILKINVSPVLCIYVDLGTNMGIVLKINVTETLFHLSHDPRETRFRHFLQYLSIISGNFLK